MAVARIATCSLAQWSLDFEGNLNRIKESIIQAKQRGYVPFFTSIEIFSMCFTGFA